MAQASLQTRFADSPLLRYGLPVVSCLLATALSVLAEHYGFRDIGMPLYLFAISVSAWYAGSGSAALAVLLSIVFFDYLFTEPRYSFYVSASELPYFAVFVAFAFLVAWFSAVRRRVERDLRQARDHLQIEVAERTRIAQELHDTLLQGVISASMQLHVVADQVPPGSSTKSALDRVLTLMGRVTEEGRNAVGGLRARQKHADLGQAFSEIQKELAPQDNLGFQVTVEGQPKPVHPVLQDEIYSIGREALTNAFRHALAKKIEVELEYAHFGLRVLIRDNGVGFDSDILRFGRHGHWGLSGMRERSKRIGANLKVFSRPAAGTEVELIVPAPIAFGPLPGGHSKWFNKILPACKQILHRTPKEYPQ